MGDAVGEKKKVSLEGGVNLRRGIFFSLCRGWHLEIAGDHLRQGVFFYLNFFYILRMAFENSRC